MLSTTTRFESPFLTSSGSTNRNINSSTFNGKIVRETAAENKRTNVIFFSHFAPHVFHIFGNEQENVLLDPGLRPDPLTIIFPVDGIS